MAPLSVEVHIQYIPNVRQKYKCTVLSTQTKLWWTDSVAKRVIYSNKKCMDIWKVNSDLRPNFINCT